MTKKEQFIDTLCTWVLAMIVLTGLMGIGKSCASAKEVVEQIDYRGEAQND
jgi:hypothetical protein